MQPESLLRQARDERGFTLIEALVALAVTAAGLAAIGQLGFETLSTARRAEDRFVLTATARKAFAALTANRSATEGGSGGQMDGAVWRLRSSAFAFDAPGAAGPQEWAPQAERLVVEGASGAKIVVDTVRLRPIGAPR